MTNSDFPGFMTMRLGRRLNASSRESTAVMNSAVPYRYRGHLNKGCH